jgi:uncharacterized protein (TIGR02246 family)
MNMASKSGIFVVLGLIALAAGWGCLAKENEQGKAPPAKQTVLAQVPAATKAAPAAATPTAAAAETSADKAAALSPLEIEIRGSAEEFVKAFNAGDAAKVTAHFAEAGEIIDEDGNQYQGTAEVKELFTAFFTKFPGSKLVMDIESVRSVAPNVVIEEGTRVTTTKEEKDQAQVRYSAVRTKVGDRWVIASWREFSDDPAPSPGDQLAGLDWLIGDWINEGSDAVVKIKYTWSEDKNFILANLDIQKAGKDAMKCQQRIGWDPAQQKIRSWLFDSDGGFSEGIWAATDKDWIVKSTATLPDGQTGSATITYTRNDDNHFSIKGTQRIVGNSVEPDFDLKVVRKPPEASK